MRGVLLGTILCITLSVPAQKIVSVADFGAHPGDTLNDREAIQKAVDFCKANEVPVLLIPPGRYRITDSFAVKIKQDWLSGKMGKNPQDVVFTPYYPYTRGISLKAMKGLRIEAAGAWLMAEGWMEPLSIEFCSDITINGLTI